MVIFQGVFFFPKSKELYSGFARLVVFLRTSTGTNTVKVSTPPNDHPTIFAKKKIAPKILRSRWYKNKHVL